MTCRSRLALLGTALLLSVLLLPACRQAEAPLRVVAAASLRGVMDELTLRYEAQDGHGTVQVETGGSVALARRVRDLGADADLLFLADNALFGELLQPDWTTFHLRYATDRMVLAFTDESAGADAIDTQNWPSVLADPGTTIAMADPERAPVGYRTLMVLRLFDLLQPGQDLEATVRARVGQRHLRANVADLLAPLQAGAVDYAFLYSTTAAAAGLRTIELPADINLGDMRLAPTYARVAIDRGVGLPARTGGPVVFGVSLPTASPRRSAAIAFLRIALGAEGRDLLAAVGLQPIQGEDRPVGFVLPADIEQLLDETR